MTREELIKAMTRELCRHHGTAHCSTVCLSHTATHTRDGQCPEATRVWANRSIFVFSALCATIPGLADLIDGKAVVVPTSEHLTDDQAAAMWDAVYEAWDNCEDSEGAGRLAHAAMLAASPYTGGRDE